MEFLIGRQVTGSNDIIVPQEFNAVSRIHAKITIDEDNITIEDQDSTNGTFVNGVNIIKKVIKSNDKITLSKETEYLVDLNSIIAKYKKIINENKTDYSEEFDELKKYYDNYLREKEKIEKKKENKILVVVIAAVLFLLLNFISTKIPIPDEIKNKLPPNISIILYSIISIYASNFFSKQNDIVKKTDALNILKAKYKEFYKCPNPKCKEKTFDISKNEYSWATLKEKKACKCGAIYSK